MEDKPIPYKEEMAEEVERMRKKMRPARFICDRSLRCRTKIFGGIAYFPSSGLRWTEGKFQCYACFARKAGEESEEEIHGRKKIWDDSLTLQQADGLLLQKKLHELRFRKL